MNECRFIRLGRINCGGQGSSIVTVCSHRHASMSDNALFRISNENRIAKRSRCLATGTIP